MSEENIFDARGMLRADLENMQVPDDRRPAFNALVASVKAAEAAESNAMRADAVVAQAVKAHDLAVASQPKWTRHDEWLVMTGKKPAREIDLTSGPVLRDAEDALGVARQELRDARQMVADARTLVAKRLADYTATMPVLTPEQNAREFIATSNAERAARAAGRIPPRAYRGGASMVDRMANAMNGGSGPGSRAGGGASYKRGAYSLAEASRENARRARALAAAKAS